MSERVVSIKRALHDMFWEIKIAKLVYDPIPENGLDSLMETASRALHTAIRKRNCFKFYLVCDAEFQVFSWLYIF